MIALVPAVQRLLPNYPDIKVEIVVDYGLSDIVADRYDAGVRLGGIIAKDMIAVPIGPEMRMATVGAPSYFASRAKPLTPHDLTDHACINLRLPTYGGLYAWEYDDGAREVKVRVDGPLVFNSVPLILEAALAGCGLAHLTEDQVLPYIGSGRLVRVLADWCLPFSGYHLYYPSRRQPSPAFNVLAEALRHRAPKHRAKADVSGVEREALVPTLGNAHGGI
jgi:DNA-binding transcriptional LysR family regulator